MLSALLFLIAAGGCAIGTRETETSPPNSPAASLTNVPDNACLYESRVYTEGAFLNSQDKVYRCDRNPSGQGPRWIEEGRSSKMVF
jgi:hypothetical protein